MKNSSDPPTRKVVGFFRQIVILLWKNSILFRRNISGTLAEILAAFIFLFILLLIRFFADSTKINDQSYIKNPTFNLLSIINATTNRELIMYYPNNSFVEELVTNAYQLIKSRKPNFNATSIEFLIMIV
jgi:hypothetical protein